MKVRTIRAGIAGLALAGTMALGTTALASGTGSDGSGQHAHDRSQICSHVDDLKARAADREAKFTARLAKLTDLRAKAEAAGKTELVAKIDKRISAVNDRHDRFEQHVAKAQAWVAEHCNPDSPAPGAAPTSTTAA